MRQTRKTAVSIIVFVAAISGIAQAAESTGHDSAEARYNQLPGPELEVRYTQDGHPVLGTEVTQKSDPDGDLCRKYVAVTPGAKPNYNCFTVFFSNDDARAAFDGSSAPEYQAQFFLDGSPSLGSYRWEKAVQYSPVVQLLCVKMVPVIPNPTAQYTCYLPTHSLGGGVTTGN